MNNAATTHNGWQVLLVVLLAAVAVGTMIVTVWPPYV